MSYRNDRYDIAVSEVKPRSNANTNNVVESDLVKIGKEMKWMINNLIKRGTENPVVCGILLQGFVLTTYKMNLLYPKIYHMIGVKSVTLPKSLHEVTSLPPALKAMLQIKVSESPSDSIFNIDLENINLPFIKKIEHNSKNSTQSEKACILKNLMVKLLTQFLPSYTFRIPITLYN